MFVFFNIEIGKNIEACVFNREKLPLVTDVFIISMISGICSRKQMVKLNYNDSNFIVVLIDLIILLIIC